MIVVGNGSGRNMAKRGEIRIQHGMGMALNNKSCFSALSCLFRLGFRLCAMQVQCIKSCSFVCFVHFIS